MKAVIDRFEGDYAVCEKPDRQVLNIPRNKLPPQAKEGDVIIIEAGSITLDPAATTLQRKSAEEKMKGLWK